MSTATQTPASVHADFDNHLQVPVIRRFLQGQPESVFLKGGGHIWHTSLPVARILIRLVGPKSCHQLHRRILKMLWVTTQSHTVDEGQHQCSDGQDDQNNSSASASGTRPCDRSQTSSSGCKRRRKLPDSERQPEESEGDDTELPRISSRSAPRKTACVPRYYCVFCARDRDKYFGNSQLLWRACTAEPGIQGRVQTYAKSLY